jgi:DNA modification methylase
MINQIIHGDCFEVLKDIPDSEPVDNSPLQLKLF